MRLFILSNILFLSLILCSQSAFAQLSNEMIWYSNELAADYVPGFNFTSDGIGYTKLEEGKVNKYSVVDDRLIKTLFDASQLDENAANFTNFQMSKNGLVLLTMNEERIYRYSRKADFAVLDPTSMQVTTVTEGAKQMYANFNAPSTHIAYVQDNNLYVKSLATGAITPITTDGVTNFIINGATDWVYEEEFGLVEGYQWSPDGQSIAYYRFDETEVPEYTIYYDRDEVYPVPYTFKYPKVGEANSKVSIHIYNLQTGRSTPVNLPSSVGDDYYIPRILWTPDSRNVCITWMNRHQNYLKLFLANPQSGQVTTLLEEKSEFYIDIHDHLQFLKDERKFIWLSEQDGNLHAYLYNMNGKLDKQLTKGNWEITDYHGYDEKTGDIYYTSTEVSPLERYVYRQSTKRSSSKTLLTPEKGWNSASFGPQFKYFMNKYSTINSPGTITLCTGKDGKVIRELADNHRLAAKMKDMDLAPVEFFDFPIADGTALNGWMVKPTDFDENKEYPLFMFLYGGPGSQQVADHWKGSYYWWFQMLAQNGYVVACVDNRGTGGRGEAFKKMTYLNLGKYETEDQIAAAQWLSAKPWIDASKTGIFGWSYGGYMSSLCVLKGNQTFEAAIAVAPVTNWKWYDNIYTERFMRTAAENEKGYKENSPVYFADSLKGAYLLVHGTCDDNVHFQHTSEMANALIMANKQFETYFYPNRNHGIYGGPTRLHLFTKITNFIKDNL